MYGKNTSACEGILGMASWGLLGSILEVFWVLFGSIRALLRPFGASRGRLGSLWRAPECISRGPGYLLEPSWGPLGPSWRLLRPSWRPLGPSWGPLGALLGCLGPVWRASWATKYRKPCVLRCFLFSPYKKVSKTTCFWALSAGNHVFYGVFGCPHTNKCQKPRVFGP